jgi:hypothetical protein
MQDRDENTAPDGKAETIADDGEDAREEALATLEAVQELFLADMQHRIGLRLPDYDAARAGTLHGWFVDRGGDGEEGLRACLALSQSDASPTLEEKAARFGVSTEIFAQHEAATRRRLGQQPVSVASILRAAVTKRSSRYTDPWWFARLEQLARALFAARDAHFRPPHPLSHERPRREEIVLGTLPGVNVRADVMPIARGRYRIILVDETVFVFSFLLGQILDAALVPNGDERWSLDSGLRATHLKENTWIGEQATALFRTYALKGHLRGVSALKLDKAREPGIAVSVTAAQLFVIGHELAHCFQPEPNAWSTPAGLEKYSPRCQRELDADISGLQLAIHAGRDQGWGQEIVVTQAVLFLLGMAKLEAAVSILSGEEKDMWAGTETHPSFLTRCSELLNHIDQLVPPERVALTRQNILQSHALFQDVLVTMQNDVRQDAASGLSAHPIWRIHHHA